MNIMLIDDDELTLDIFSKALELNGISCKAYSQAQDAIANYSAGEYDVVICDYFMPTLNGLDTLKQLLDIDSEAKIFLYSAHADRTVALKALSMGAHDFFSKPIDWNSVMKKLEYSVNSSAISA